MSNLYIPVCAFFCSFLMMIIFFSKKRIKTRETNIFSMLLISSFADSVLSVIIIYLGYTDKDNMALYLLNRIDFLQYLLWAWMFFLYIFHVTFYDKEKIYKKFDKIFRLSGIVNAIIYLLVFMLPFYIQNSNNIMYAHGPAVNVLYVSCGLYIFAIISCVIFNFKNLANKKYTPVYALIVLAVILLIVRSINPGLLIISGVVAYIDLIMYFTIENPDLKLLREIQKSKEYAEHANNEKAMFLYNMTQEIRTPIKRIEEKCEDILNENDIEVLKEEIRGIKFATKKLTGTINGILDVSALDNNTNIEIINNKYSPDTLLKQIISISKNNLADKNKDIEFRTNIDNNIPEYLYGDSIRIKQIIMTIINNAIKHTEKGFIEFDVNAVIKYDVCRLIITIEDSGIGIEANKLENLFYNEHDISDENINKADDTRESLSIIKVLTNLIGGTVVVNSELSKGSKFTVVLDQKIYVDEKDTTMNAVEKLSVNKKILIVDDDEVSLKNSLKVLNKFDVIIETVMWGQECLEKIRRKEKYNLILLDEDMPKLNGIKTFEKLKEEDHFDIPVVLMIESKHMEYKNRYIENGFAGCIEKPIKKNDIKDILKEIEEK